MSLLERLKAALADHYALEREVGRGGMATVYLAQDLKHHRPVALKVLNAEIASAIGPQRFLREIEIAARLTHPHILPLLDSGEVDGLLYYVMPYIEGESLRQHLSRQGAVPLAESLRLMREVADALAYAHDQGIVHRDIKPDNVLLSGRHALVTDFGVAKAVREAASGVTVTATGVALGTPAYMAPEQAVGSGDIDHRADIYAFGVMAYEMLTGHAPFEATTVQGMLAAHLTESPVPIQQRREDIPPDLAALVMRCLEKKPEDRWPSAQVLLEEIELNTTPWRGIVTGRIRAAIARPVRRFSRWMTPARAGLAAVLVVLLGVSVVVLSRGARIRWARATAIPTIQQMIVDARWGPAYTLAQQARAVIGEDSILTSLWPRFAGPLTVRSEPPGAQVYRRDYNAPADAPWELLGSTPVDSVPIPRAPFLSRFRIVLAGFDTVIDQGEPATRSYRLDSVGSIPGMVRVAAGRFPLFLAGLDHLPPFTIGEYFIGRHEVTNREYRRFVADGGYTRRELWEHPFADGARQLTWAQAMERLRDRTGRPGPATWEVGDYAAGQDDFPVTGVSWYEAAAYARFAGAELPTLFHWARAALPSASHAIVPLSNMEGRGKELAPVGTFQGIGAFGAADVAGNAREWVSSEAGSQRYLLGGGWNDEPDMFTNAYAASPFDRSDANGFRLARYLPGDTTLATARRPIVAPAYRDFRRIPPVSDATFAIYRRLYDYDPAPLRAVIEEVDSTAADWIRQRVTFDAAYGGERMIANLFLPRTGSPPYQAVVFYPGDGTIAVRSSPKVAGGNFDFIVKDGRAVLFPVYKSTFERGDGLVSVYPSETNGYRDHVIAWAKDFRRSVDYLTSRPDIDASRIAYYGYSWGGLLGPLIIAVEPRVKVGVFNVGGLLFQKAFPEAEPITFLPRVRVPMLLLSGRYDYFYPVETSQKPMFDLLGTPPEHKRHVIEEGAHFIPRPTLIKETLNWLDKYLGPVR